MILTMKLIKKTLVMLFISANLLGTISPCAALPQQGLLPSDSPTTPTSLPLSWNATSSPLPKNTTVTNTHQLSNKIKPPHIYCKSFCIHKGLYPTFDYGPVNLTTSNPDTLLTCLDQMWDHLNPTTHKKKPPQRPPHRLATQRFPLQLFPHFPTLSSKTP
ncbi:hypothetical protein CB0940_03796 [Cercospora beticola]|uniref:Uncharacterized protein n=1 Tax=Cercospora beticola TaxID=122368 RepID=A0A2G5I243_CERBT|nr:hypothetical protein CB0940_03796 [Cercospora beticola]PIA98866.1 hypothetical protein CB0940_03796 [Cercospora beticola]